jgi:citrate lyase subunit beta/citryl-CoA lyase
MLPRTYLFVPGNRPERFGKALSSPADAVVIDLEDAVPLAAKATARDAIARWCDAAGNDARARVIVRVNDTRSDELDEDLRMLQESGLATCMLPKVETAAQVAAVRGCVQNLQVVALVETARGIVNVHEVAGATGVSRLVFGTLDFALDLDMDIDGGADGLSHAASAIALASRAANLPAPVAGVTPQIDNTRRLLSDLAWARRHGFGAKLCIHPGQVQPIHEALAPTAAAADWARRVLAAEAASPGAAQLDGRMIDLPVVLQARRLLQRAAL